PSTPALAHAVARAGGLGFLAAGYLTPERLGEDVASTRAELDRFGVNVFVPGRGTSDPRLVDAYAQRLQAEAHRIGIELGQPRADDDGFEAKIDLLEADPVAVVSFTFGLPPGDAIPRLHAVGSEVWLTVTSADEARAAAAGGADALIVQGFEAGGHRGVFADDETQSDLTLLAALELVGAASSLPMIGAGAIMTGAAVAAVLVAGAQAAQVGTAFLLTPEAGTSEAQRRATMDPTPTALTRAFSGRSARGVSNRFLRTYGPLAPSAYPEVNQLTAPLRAHGREHGDPDLINLWAGQAHVLAQARGAEELTRQLAREAGQAIARWAGRLPS
ncbi:MAG: nitronate monooxygenase, partial [Acidimicrobiales bacterium]|nr:nitronate monooxygenase [Acidimicrobiales bacterium]